MAGCGLARPGRLTPAQDFSEPSWQDRPSHGSRERRRREPPKV